MICSQCHLSRRKTTLSFQSYLSMAFKLSSSFWEGAQHPRALLKCLDPQFHQSLLKRDVLVSKLLRNSRNDLVDTNSAQIFSTILKREQLERHSHFFYCGEKALALILFPILILTVNIEIEESALVTDLKTESSVLRRDTNQGHALCLVLSQRCLKFGFLLLALNHIFSKQKCRYATESN